MQMQWINMSDYDDKHRRKQVLVKTTEGHFYAGRFLFDGNRGDIYFRSPDGIGRSLYRNDIAQYVTIEEPRM